MTRQLLAACQDHHFVDHTTANRTAFTAVATHCHTTHHSHTLTALTLAPSANSPHLLHFTIPKTRRGTNNLKDTHVTLTMALQEKSVINQTVLTMVSLCYKRKQSRFNHAKYSNNYLTFTVLGPSYGQWSLKYDHSIDNTQFPDDFLP